MRKSLIFLVLLSFIKCSSDSEVNYDDQEAPSVFQSSITSNASVGGNQCSDRDRDNFCDDIDYWPLNPKMHENFWGIKNDFQPNFIFTYDIDEIVQSATTNSMLGAIEEFGNWGPIELWVIGQDYEGVILKTKNFCDTRISRGQGFYSPFYTHQGCKEFMLYPLEGQLNLPVDLVSNDSRLKDQGGYFNYYMTKSIESIENNYPTGFGKSLNGRRDWGIKLFIFSNPIGFLSPENYYKEMVNIYYEYYHALQESALIDEELGETNEFGDETRRGPHWFYSGASSYMADYAVRKRNSENNLDEMKIWLKQQFLFGKSLVEQNGCNEIRLKDISPENCFLLKFYWGEPAVAYLLSSISNPNALNDIFYPNLYKLGFKSSFELTFNKTLEEFYVEWDTIMGKSIDERIELIDSFGF
jgi:hypothetical protein